MKAAAPRLAHTRAFLGAIVILVLCTAAPSAHALQSSAPQPESVVHGETVEAAAEETRGSLVMMIVTTLAVPVSLGLLYFRRWYKLDGRKLRDRLFEPAVGLGLLLLLLAAGALGGFAAHRVFIGAADPDAPAVLSVKEIVVSLTGAYVGQALVLLAAWKMLRPRTKSRVPRVHRHAISVPGAVAAGVGALLLFWPLVLTAGLGAGKVQEWLLDEPARPIAHETLAMLVDSPADGWRAALIVLVIFGPGIFEEIVYRGILHRMLRIMAIKPWTAIVITSVIFAVMHGNVADAQALVALFVLSLGFGWIYERTGRIAAPIAMHMLFNLANAMLALSVG